MQETEQEIEFLRQENSDLQQALKKVKGALERSIQDYRGLQNIHNDFKNQFKEVQIQKEQLQNNIKMMQIEQNERNMEYESNIKDLKTLIEEKQFEIEEIEAKIHPNKDFGLEKLKIIQELEVPHKLQLERKDFEFQQIEDKLFAQRRENEVLKVQIENLQEETEKQLKELKAKHQIDLKDQQLELLSKPISKAQQQKNRQVEKDLQWENDQLKAKLSAQETKLNKLRIDLNIEKEEKSRQIQSIYKEIENERLETRRIQTQNEKLQDTVKQLEQELKEKQKQILQNQQNNFLLSSQNTPSKSVKALNQTQQSIGGQQQYNLQDNVLIDQDIQKLNERENYMKILQKRITTLQQQITSDQELSKQTQKTLEEQLDRQKKDKKRLDEELRTTREELQGQLQEEQKLNKNLTIEKKELQLFVNDLESQNQELKHNLLRIGGNKSFLQQDGVLQDVSMISTKAMKNQSMLYPPNSTNQYAITPEVQQQQQQPFSNQFSNNYSSLQQQKETISQVFQPKQQQQKPLSSKQDTAVDNQNSLNYQSTGPKTILVHQNYASDDFNNEQTEQIPQKLQEQQQNQQVQQLQQQLSKQSKKEKLLKQKLKEANAKIVDLLQQKLIKKGFNDSSNITNPYKIEDHSTTMQLDSKLPYATNLEATNMSQLPSFIAQQPVQQQYILRQQQQQPVANTILIADQSIIPPLQQTQQHNISVQNMSGIGINQTLPPQNQYFSMQSDKELMNELNAHRLKLEQLSNEIEGAYKETFSMDHINKLKVDQTLKEQPVYN